MATAHTDLEPTASRGVAQAAAADSTLARADNGELIGGIVRDARDMAQNYFELAKLDVKHQITLAKRSLIAASIGGAITLVGVIVLALAAGYALALVLPLWAAMGIVGAALALLGVIALGVGAAIAKNIEPVPHEVIEDAKEDAQWIGERT